MSNKHEIIEKNIGLMIVLVVIAISFGGLVEIVPLMFQKDTTEPIEGLRPLTALELQGRDVYIREGCNVCHSQMIRSLHSETERYGYFSVAGEFVYDHPHVWGSKRTGPDLARVGGRYSDRWHRVHLNNPRDVVPESNMPSFWWLEERSIDSDTMKKKLSVLRRLGVPYTDEDIATVDESIKGKTEMDAVIAYLQQLGTLLSYKR